MAEANAQFRILRGGAPDQIVDKDALLFGRLASCDVSLEHPAVSRIHAGINFLDGRFYIINLSTANFVTVNGRRIAPGETDIVVDGDLLLIGPFAVRIKVSGQSLSATVKMAVEADLMQSTQSIPRQSTEEAAADKADVLKVFWEKRSRDKDDWGSRLRPTEKPQPGKARINWKPTADLRRAWKTGIFLWTVLVLTGVAVFSYYMKPETFAPMPVSSVHASLLNERGIAAQPNANACTTCHTPDKPVEETCASCHQGERFHASNTKKHQDAGITCVSCHSEHKGSDYKSNIAASQSCAQCHDDSNKRMYNGKGVGTPHGKDGYFYPAGGGKWNWDGVEKILLPQIPELSASATGDRDEQAKVSRHFHSLHVGRLSAPPGMTADSKGLVSCSTCHKSFDPIDVVTPKETCASCHVPKTQSAEAVQANCISCHVQHPYSLDRWSGFLTPDALDRRRIGASAQIEELRRK